MIRTRMQGDTPFFPNMLNNSSVEVCLKEDVDATIEKLKRENEELKKCAKNLILDNYLQDKELRHQKYKRCLAMAEWCDAEADVADADGDYEDMRWYQKWHKRWLELAEKFKEAK